MKLYRICFLGFGNVGRALARLFVSKSTELRDKYGIEWEVVGVATRRMGWRACENAIDVARLLDGSDETESVQGIDEWLARAKPDVVFETTSLNPETGQPAIEYLRKSLQAGAHTITANKAPLVYAYDELNELAIAQGRKRRPAAVSYVVSVQSRERPNFALPAVPTFRRRISRRSFQHQLLRFADAPNRTRQRPRRRRLRLHARRLPHL